MLIDGAYDIIGHCRVACCFIGWSEFIFEFGKYTQSLGLYDGCAEGFRIIYICGLHPFRIALFAPVDERCFAFYQAVGRVYSKDIILQAVLNYRIDIFKPPAVACNFVQFVCRHSPYHAIGADRPCATASGVLNDASCWRHFFHKWYFWSLRLHIGHGEKYRVADVASPYSGPFAACAQCGVRFDGIYHFVKPHVVDRFMEGVGRRQLWILAYVILEFPAFLDRVRISGRSGICRYNFLGIRRRSIKWALGNCISVPAICVGSDDVIVRTVACTWSAEHTADCDAGKEKF